MHHRVLVTAAAFVESGQAAAGPLRAGGCEVVAAPQAGPLPEERLFPLLCDVDAVVAASDAYTDRIFAAAPRLKVVARWGVGVDSIDLDAATRYGVVVANAPGTNTEAVADYTFGMMLALARRLVEANGVMRDGGWREIRGVDLWRKTLGIVGFGAVGRAVTRRACGFEMRVLAFDPFVPANVISAAGAEPASLDVLLSESDFVTLHASLTPETRGMIGASELRRMRPAGYLINAARGALVDEDALVAALKEGRLAGAAVDAYAEEPPAPEHPLRRLSNCLALPHSAFNSIEVAAATNAAVTEAILAALRGDRPANTVNPAVYETAAYRGRNAL